MTHAPTRGTRAWTNLCTLWQTKINQNGGWTCRACGNHIPPHNRNAWQLGHPNDMTTGPTLLADLEPECPCNMSRGATAGNRARTRANLPASRSWK